MGVIAKYMFPLEWAIRIINGEWIWFIPFFLINALSVVVFILVTLKYYKRVFLKINQQQRSNVFKDEHINVEKKGIIRVLLAREFKKYFSFPAYVMNTIMSPLMSIIMTVVLYLQLRNAVDGPSVEFITLILVAINAFIGGMSPTTSVSLSLEGKEFWILKSSPIKPASVFIAKILMNVILFGVGSVVVAVILFAFMGLNIISSILVLITLLLSVLFASMAGILANLLLPKMNFDQPIKVVKQSMSVLVSMVVGLIATALAAGLGFIGFKNTQNIDITLGSAIAVYILLSLIVGLVLKYIGPKLYRKLEA
jgi:ABC-2 type transport system permease protein